MVDGQPALLVAPIAGWFASLQEYLPRNEFLSAGIVFGLLVLAALAAHLIARFLLLRVLSRVVVRSPSQWTKELDRHDVLLRLVPVIPLLIIFLGLPVVPGVGGALVEFLRRVLVVAIAFIAARGLSTFLDAINAIYSQYPISRGRPIKGYLQVVKILGYGAAVVFSIAALVGQSPLILLSGLGAMTAVIMLIFRDTLLSLVAGIQLTSNDLIRVGDWIEMPQFNADGNVTDIALNVVTVQNWDKTVTVIPAHKFLEHSFRNWRSMFESGGRRIKRALYIDMSSVRFLRPEEIERFRRFVALRDYMEQKLAELAEFNTTKVEKEYADILANGRHLTNIGTLRAYISGYLRRHPSINQDLTFLVRQLQPTAQGLPIEIYVFTNDTRWANYEAIQADIFDHILAIISEFDLRVYQQPSGRDLSLLSKAG